MAIIESDLGKLIFNLILTLLMVYGFKILFNSAKDSLKRTGGKWTSIIDEALIAFVGIVVLVMCWSMGPVGAVNLADKWVRFIWGLIAPILRNLGLPV